MENITIDQIKPLSFIRLRGILLVLQQDYNIDLDIAIDRIIEVVTFAKEQQHNLLIRYTPEDTVRSPIENVIAAASAALLTPAI